MKSVKRYSDNLRLDAVVLDENGFLKTKAYATRTGVFVYRRPDGSIFRELRVPQEVFRPDSMQSLRMVPITNDHPSEKIVNSKNAKRLQVGMTGDVHQEDHFLKAEVAITDASTIDEVEKGKRELSCGYTCELEETPGVWEGQAYDAIQRNIVYNHLAVVMKGRAGPEVRMHLDAEDAIEVHTDEKERKEEKTDMKVKLGDKEYEMSDEAGKAVLDIMAKMKKEMDGMKSQKKEDEFDALQAKADHLESENKKLQEEKKILEEKADAGPSAEEIQGLVKNRVALEKKAAGFLKEDQKIDSMSDREIKIACIKASREDFSEEGKSDEYINAAFDFLGEIKKNAAKKDTFKADKDGNDTPSLEEIRKKNMREDEALWEKPLREIQGK